jgi:hypothetical protein
LVNEVAYYFLGEDEILVDFVKGLAEEMSVCSL